VTAEASSRAEFGGNEIGKSLAVLHRGAHDALASRRRARRKEDSIVNHDTGGPVPKRETRYESGPSDLVTRVNVGNILNVQYDSALDLHRRLDFANAKLELDYFIDGHGYPGRNRRQREFFSPTNYLRGLIDLDQATGLGLSRANPDFDDFLLWDSDSHTAYIGLERVWKEVGDEALPRAVLEYLIGLGPDEIILRQARELSGRGRSTSLRA
jgi:hypothetical protein